VADRGTTDGSDEIGKARNEVGKRPGFWQKEPETARNKQKKRKHLKERKQKCFMKRTVGKVGPQEKITCRGKGFRVCKPKNKDVGSKEGESDPSGEETPRKWG